MYGHNLPPLVELGLTGLPKSGGGGYAPPPLSPPPLPPSLVYNQSSEYWIFKLYELSSRAAKDLNCPFLTSALDQNLDKQA